MHLQRLGERQFLGVQENKKGLPNGNFKADLWDHLGSNVKQKSKKVTKMDLEAAETCS